MKNLRNIYLAAIYSLAAIFIIFSFFVTKSYSLTPVMTFILIFAASFSEYVNIINDKESSVSMTAPILAFSSIFLSYPEVLAVIATFSFFSIYFRQKKYYEPIRHLSHQNLFNISQYVILASATKFLIIESGLPKAGLNGLFFYLLIGLFYNILNVLLVAGVYYLSTGNSLITKSFSKDFLRVIYYFTLIFIMLVFSYYAYDLMGLTIVIIFIMTLQKSILFASLSTKLMDQLTKDDLTNAFSRNYMRVIVEDYIKLRRPFTFVFIDMDDFKKINDEYGHFVGDQALISFANALKEHFREEDKVFRFGGDEFCIVLHGLKYDFDLAKRLLEIEAKSLCITGDVELKLGFSAGFYQYDGKKEVTFEEVLNQADMQMYSLKKR